MTPAAIPMAREAIRDLTRRRARALASHALTLATAGRKSSEFLFEALAVVGHGREAG